MAIPGILYSEEDVSTLTSSSVALGGIIICNLSPKSQGPKVGRRDGAPRKARSRLLRAGGGALFRRRPDDDINLKFTCDPNVTCRGLRRQLTLQVRAKWLHLELGCGLEALQLQFEVPGGFRVDGMPERVGHAEEHVGHDKSSKQAKAQLLD